MGAAGGDPVRRRAAAGLSLIHIFQNFELLDNMTGRENILLPTSLHGVSEAESSQRLKQLADYLDVYKRQILPCAVTMDFT